MSEWQPIETCKDGEEESLHVRGVWVVMTKTKEPLYWQADTGFIDEFGHFIGQNDESYGWDADDYSHWLKLPKPPELPARPAPKGKAPSVPIGKDKTKEEILEIMEVMAKEVMEEKAK